MALLAEKSRFDADSLLAEQLRHSNACEEMAAILKTLGCWSSVPDFRWMAAVAADELCEAARRGRLEGRAISRAANNPLD